MNIVIRNLLYETVHIKMYIHSIRFKTLCYNVGSKLVTEIIQIITQHNLFVNTYHE